MHCICQWHCDDYNYDYNELLVIVTYFWMEYLYRRFVYIHLSFSLMNRIDGQLGYFIIVTVFHIVCCCKST